MGEGHCIINKFNLNKKTGKDIVDNNFNYIMENRSTLKGIRKRNLSNEEFKSRGVKYLSNE